MIAATVLMLLAAGMQHEDALMPARQGKYLCVKPDRAARTCEVTIIYTPRDDGTYRTTTTFVVSRDPWTTMAGHANVRATADSVCEVYRPETIDSSEVLVDGAPAGDAVAKRWRDEYRRGLVSFEGRTLCSHFHQEGDMIRTTTTVDGEPREGWGATMIWVTPGEDYRLR